MEPVPSLLPILKRIPLFAELDSTQHEEIVKNITLQYYPKGHVLFSEGDAGDSMFIIKNGMCQVTRQGRELAVFGPNDFFGEMALISEAPRNATATAVSDLELFMLKKADFFKLVEKTPGLASRISTEFIERVKKNTKEGQI